MHLVDLVKENSKKNIVLLGPGGSGKTMQLINLFKSLLNEKYIIPIYITLSSFDDTKDYLLNQFILEYTQCGIKKDDNLKLVVRDFFHKSNLNRFVFILDAVNETSSAYIEYVYDEINFLAALDNVQVVMACRYNTKPSEKLFSTYRLMPLDKNKVSEEIVNYSNMNKEMKKLLRLPMFYSIYIKLGIDERKVLTQEELLEIYFEFVANKIVRDETRTNMGATYQRTFKKLLFSFLPHYVFEKQMHKRNYMVLNDDLFECWEEYKRKYGINADKSCASILQDLGVIEEIKERNGSLGWKFIHESYFDYFVYKTFQDASEIDELEQSIVCMIKITSFYDEKCDREKAYKYGKAALKKFESMNSVRDVDLQLKIAYGYIVCGYAVLHYKKWDSDYLEYSYAALIEADNMLNKIKNSNLIKSDNIQEYNRIKTTLTGNLGAYFYEAGDYQNAQKYHFESLAERQKFLHDSDDKESKDYWNLRLAMAYKNIASDFYQLSKQNELHRYSYLELAVTNHKKAHNIYKDIHMGINKDLIVCLNRMIGCIIPFVEMESFNIVKEIYGDDLGEVVGNILLDLLKIFEYYSTNTINFNEMEDSLSKTRKLLGIAKKRKVLDENINTFLLKLADIRYQNEYLNKVILTIIEDANND